MTDEGRRVWVVERGTYSNYEVVGIYSSREGAERIAAKLNETTPSDSAGVNERLLDPGIDALNHGLDRFDVWMRRDGTVDQVAKMPRPWEFGPEYGAYVNRGYRALNVEVWARDENHAIKIANEKRLQMIANGEWSENDAD